ncbi:MAG TPA: type I-E CRISPR-associated protein Cas6/Cse3/CasE [Chitinispirillaceae bacterium]|nr:type I-E CRISPR-associated protein Cas6/Cse3/CasE [Chitinispirillaceae bacterium]
MNWLTRMEIDADIAFSEGGVDNYSWHKKIWSCFPNMQDQTREFLSRIDVLDGSFFIWMLSPDMPVCPNWCPADKFYTKQIKPTFLNHRYYAFDIRVNPTKCLVTRIGGKRIGHGKCVPITDEVDLRNWLIRKGNVRCRDNNTNAEIPGGFRIVEDKPLEIRPMVEYHFSKKGHQGYHGGVQFRGTLEVTNREHFIETYKNGIGSAKGFGFGLLLISPIELK